MAEIIPQLWGLDYTFWSYRKMFARNILESIVTLRQQGQLEFFYYNRPVSRVEVQGVVTGILRRRAKIWVTLDDGTGLIHCVKYVNENQYSHLDPMKGAVVGSLATIRGSLQAVETNEFPFSLTLAISAIDVCLDVNTELYFWTSTLFLHKNEYMLGWRRPLALKFPSQAAYQMCSCVGPTAVSAVEAVILKDISVSDGLHGISTGPQLVHTSRSSKAEEVRATMLFCPCVAAVSVIDPYCEFRIDLLQCLLERQSADEAHTTVDVLSNMSCLERDREVVYLAKSFLKEANTRKKMLPEESTTYRSLEPAAADHSDADTEESEEGDVLGVHDSSAKYAAKSDSPEVRALIASCIRSLHSDGVLLTTQSVGTPESTGTLVTITWMVAVLKQHLSVERDLSAKSTSRDQVEAVIIEQLLSKWETVPAWRWKAVLRVLLKPQPQPAQPQPQPQPAQPQQQQEPQPQL